MRCGSRAGKVNNEKDTPHSFPDDSQQREQRGTGEGGEKESDDSHDGSS